MTKTFCSVSMWLYWVSLALMWHSSMAQTRLCGRPLADTLDILCAGRGFHMGKRDGRSIGSIYGRQPGTDDSNIQVNNLQSPSRRNGFIDNNKQTQDFDGNQSHKSNSISPMTYFKRKRYELVNFLKNVDVTIPHNYTDDFYQRQLVAVGGDKDHYRPASSLLSSPRNRALDIRKRRQARPMNIVEECCLRPCSIRTLLSYCAAPDEPVTHWPEHIVRHWFRMTSPRTTTTQRPRQVAFSRPPAQINRGRGRNRSQFFYVPSENLATRSPLLLEQRQS